MHKHISWNTYTLLLFINFLEFCFYHLNDDGDYSMYFTSLHFNLKGDCLYNIILTEL